MNTEDVLEKAKIRRYEHTLMDAENDNILHVLNLYRERVFDEGLWWAYIENAKGEKMNFKDWSKSVIELIDEMDIQIEYIGDYLVNQILKRI